MPKLPPLSRLVAVAAVFLIAVVIPHAAGWPQAGRPVELAALVLVAILASLLGVQQAAIGNRAIMPPAFVAIFCSLLLLDADVATLVATSAALAPALVDPRRAQPRLKLAGEVAIALVATQLAGLAYRSVGGIPGSLAWPWKAVPVVASVLAYVVAQGALAEVLVPYVARQPVNRSWPRNPLRGGPIYLVGATVAAALAELIDRRMWELLPVAVASLFVLYRTYADYVSRLEEVHRRREVIAFIEQGMSVVDSNGSVTLWNDALEHMLGCSRDRALGRRLDEAVPALGRTELPRTIRETLADRQPRTLAQVSLTCASQLRILQVKVLPVTGGVSLLWHDVTERTRAEQELKLTGERLTLAAEGANDGLWQWNLRTQEFYVSGRWRAMIGQAPEAGVGRPEEWLERVHADDVANLKATLDAHLAGHTDVFQHEHRIRHEDGTYRRFLCRGLAVGGTRRRRDRIAGSLTDTTEQAIAQERLRSVGFVDSLTGLSNRAVFVEGLGRRLDECRRRGVRGGFAVLYLDLDRFKIVNDSL
ncbi:MAG: PAS domain S-box protein, partial [Vicinamibacterales bacterium]